MLLANARLALAEHKKFLAAALLKCLKRLDGESAEMWFRDDEKSLEASLTSDIGSALRASKGGDESSMQQDQFYARILRSFDEGKVAPLRELDSMVGLEKVKVVARSLYVDAMTDSLLKSKGHGHSIVPRSLNFAFLGNPGTGKTTVARIFSRLLEASGTRAGHKFVQMTGSEALRKGAKSVASELAQITGGKQGVGPPPKVRRQR